MQSCLWEEATHEQIPNSMKYRTFEFPSAILGFLLFAVAGLTVWPTSDAAAADRVLKERLTEFAARVESSKAEPDAVVTMFAQEIGEDSAFFEHNPASLVTPASVLKILTTFAALKGLGAEYRFPTEVFVDSLPSEKSVSMDRSSGLAASKGEWSAGNLYVRGYGDPGMIDERLYELARTVHRRGVREVQNLIIDETLFIDPPRASGPEPYESALSAVALNHNSYAVHIAPSGATLPAFVEVTPGAPYKLVNRVKSLQAGESSILISQSRESANFMPEFVQTKSAGYRTQSAPDEMTVTVQGYIGVKSPAETQYRSVPYPASYFGAVLKHFLETAGVAVKGNLMFGETPSGAKLLFAYQSEPLAKILQDLNHYSSNFIAGQLLFAIGQDKKGYFRSEVGLQQLRQVLTGLGYPENSFEVYDASGLDKRNKVTVQQLVSVLLAVQRDYSITPDFMSSFSRFGKTGTLKLRKLLNPEVLRNVTKRQVPEIQNRADGVWGKTGTLDGVSSLAGFLELANGSRAAFAVVINGMEKNKAAQIEDEFVQLLIGIGGKQ